MNVTNPYASDFAKMVKKAGAKPLPPAQEVSVMHEIVRHDFVTKRPYLWVGLLFGLLAGIAIGYFLR